MGRSVTAKKKTRSQYRAVGTVTGLGNGRSEVPIQTAARNISILQGAQNSYGTQPNSFDKVKLPEREAEHLQSTSAEVK